MLRPALTLVALVTVFAALGAGCGGDDDDAGASPTAGSASPTVRAASPTSPAASPTPGGATSGVQSVDDAIAAVLSGDATALAALAVFQSLECTTSMEGIGGPPQCAAGEADGTPVDVFASSSCEGYYLREEQLGPELARFLDGAPRLYAAYRANAGVFPPGQYIVLFDAPGAPAGTSARALIMTDAGMVGTAFICGGTVQQFVTDRGLTDADALISPP